MMSRHVPRAKPARRQKARLRHATFTRCAAAATLLIAASGCASPDATVGAPWKMEPVYKVNHTMQSGQAYYELGRYFDGSGLWDKAIDAYRKAIAVDASNVEAYNALGVTLAQSGRPADAEITLRQAVALAPDRSHVLNNLGYVLLLAGKNDDAVAILKAALARDSGNAGAAANLQLALARATPRGNPAIAATTSPSLPRTSATHGTAHQAADRPNADVVAVTSEASPSRMSSEHVPDSSAAPSPRVTSAPSPAISTRTAAVDEPPWRLEVSNGNGVAGMAARLGRWLSAKGFETRRLTNQPSFDRQYTVVQYREGHDQAALRLARSMPASIKVDSKPTPSLRSDVRVVLGQDWVKIATCLDRDTCGSGAASVAMVTP